MAKHRKQLGVLSKPVDAEVYEGRASDARRMLKDHNCGGAVSATIDAAYYAGRASMKMDTTEIESDLAMVQARVMKCARTGAFDGLGSSAEVHADQAERDEREGFMEFIKRARVNREAGDCSEAYDDLLSAARVFGVITADRRAAGLPYPQERLFDLENESDLFFGKCVRQR